MKRLMWAVPVLGAAFAQTTGTDFTAVRTALQNEWSSGVGVVLAIFGLALGIKFVMARLRAAAK